MCSIYDNLRKGLGNVSKDRCIFIFLTLLSIFAGSYCCNISALPGFEWFIHHEYSNAIVHAFQKFRAPFSGKIVHIFPEQSAVI